jgi:DNA-directed RNA polymerase specialized sigma24 family protein
MKDTAAFDAFYIDARARLLQQTFALTGDLPAAQAAVRDAFVSAWHHWRKVSQLEDPERWVRPLAWSYAVRRHGAKIWHRQRSEDAEAARTLDALGKLSLTQRKVLLLSQLTTGSLEDLAREAELPLTMAESQLQSGTALFASYRNVDSAMVRTVLDPLARPASEARWPRPTIIRRAGSARRRTHTLIGAAVVAALLVVSGVAVTQDSGIRPRLTKEEVVAPTGPLAQPEPAPVKLSENQLLDARQVSRIAPARRWSVEETEENVTDQAPVLPCQERRYADQRAVGGLVRRFDSRPRRPGAGGPESVSAVQATELSGTVRAARRAYAVTNGWYAGCDVDRTQLLATLRVAGVGDGGTLQVLRSWAGEGTTTVVGVARTGQVTTTTLSESSPGTDPGAADLASHASLLAAAVNSLCGAPGTARCARPPEMVEVLPLPTGRVHGMIDVIDLPPVTNVDDPWVGTNPRRAMVNAASTQCDRSSFMKDGVTNALTRTFLFPEASLPDTFGLTQTVGTMPRGAAKQFVAKVRERMGTCEERNLGTEVSKVADETTRSGELVVWRVDVEVSDKQTVTYLMGISRTGTAISQLGFTPTHEVAMAPGAFVALVDRGRERAAYLPAP